MPVSSAIHGIDCDMTRADCTPIKRSAADSRRPSANVNTSRNNGSKITFMIPPFPRNQR